MDANQQAEHENAIREGFADPFECQGCGWSKFYRREEFRDGTPGDKTRICSDCGRVEA